MRSILFFQPSVAILRDFEIFTFFGTQNFVEDTKRWNQIYITKM